MKNRSKQRISRKGETENPSWPAVTSFGVLHVHEPTMSADMWNRVVDVGAEGQDTGIAR